MKKPKRLFKVEILCQAHGNGHVEIDCLPRRFEGHSVACVANQVKQAGWVTEGKPKAYVGCKRVVKMQWKCLCPVCQVSQALDNANKPKMQHLHDAFTPALRQAFLNTLKLQPIMPLLINRPFGS